MLSRDSQTIGKKQFREWMEEVCGDVADKVVKFMFPLQKKGAELVILSFNEYCAKLELLRNSKKEQLWLAFQLYDISNDGQICDLDVMSLLKV